MQVDELAEAVRRNIARLSGELAEEKEFLAKLEARSKPAPKPVREVVMVEAKNYQQPEPSQLRQVKAGEKADLIVNVLGSDGRQAPKLIRQKLFDLGVDADAGTEVKRVLWQLAKDGRVVHHKETRDYELPSQSQNGNEAEGQTL